MQKIRYEIDPHNRLVLNESGRKSGLSKFRKVLDGRFRTDENNNLSYHIKSPLSEDENIPHQIRLKGEWSLTDNHDLRLTLDKSARETFGDQITLHGEILEAGKNSILFAVTTTKKDNTHSTYVLSLGGWWKADANNRLSFHVKREKAGYDILTFNGAWEIDKTHQIVYQYEKAHLIRKRRKTHTLMFRGYWDIKDKFRISYVLSKDTDSLFEFKTSAGIFREGHIEYEIGIRLANRPKPIRQTVVLFGKWSLKRNVGLIFEIEYENKKRRAIVFGADAEITHKILKLDGEVFLRALKSQRESAVYAGAAWRW